MSGIFVSKYKTVLKNSTFLVLESISTSAVLYRIYVSECVCNYHMAGNNDGDKFYEVAHNLHFKKYDGL